MTQRVRKIIITLAFIFALVVPQYTIAQSQSQLSLAVTPPLIQLSLAPGQTWSSTLKVVNTNEYPLPLYANMALLEPNGDEGQSKFTPIVEGDEGNSLANWVKLGEASFTVSREKSFELPFTITVPQNAPPGGHYAAIIVGSQPINEKPDGPTLSVSSSISSLLFLRVAGDVVEQGDIREFTTGKTFYSKPDVNFVLRFENKGNVHIQPQGDITVYNMWGKQRGVVPINQQTRFGNVLPKSIRKFEFQWTGAWNPLEFGRYKAVAVLTYGTDEKQNVESTRYFWVIPVKETLITLGGLLLFILFFFWAIRRYIRRSLAIETQRLAGGTVMKSRTKVAASTISRRSTKPNTKKQTKEVSSVSSTRNGLMSTLIRPIRSALAEGGLVTTIRKYPLFYVSVVIILIGLIGIVLYFSQVLQGSRSYNVKVKKSDNNNVLIKDGQPQSTNQPATSTDQENTSANQQAPEQSSSNQTSEPDKSSVSVVVLNGTSVSGLAAKVATELKQQGFNVTKTGNAAKQAQTTIQYQSRDEAIANVLNKAINGKAVMSGGAKIVGQLTLIIGSDY